MPARLSRRLCKSHCPFGLHDAYGRLSVILLYMSFFPMCKKYISPPDFSCSSPTILSQIFCLHHRPISIVSSSEYCDVWESAATKHHNIHPGSPLIYMIQVLVRLCDTACQFRKGELRVHTPSVVESFFSRNQLHYAMSRNYVDARSDFVPPMFSLQDALASSGGYASLYKWLQPDQRRYKLHGSLFK